MSFRLCATLEVKRIALCRPLFATRARSVVCRKSYSEARDITMSAAADASALCGTKRQAPGHPGSISRIPVGSKELVEDGVDTRHKGEVRELSLTPAKAARQVSDGGGPHITDIRSSSSSSMTGASMIKTIVHGLTTRSVPLKLSPSMPERVRKDVQAALAKQQQQHAAANGGGNSTGASGSVSTDTLLLRSVPTILLYDDAGLELFDQITYLEEYYLTNAGTPRC